MVKASYSAINYRELEMYKQNRPHIHCNQISLNLLNEIQSYDSSPTSTKKLGCTFWELLPISDQFLDSNFLAENINPTNPTPKMTHTIRQ